MHTFNIARPLGVLNTIQPILNQQFLPFLNTDNTTSFDSNLSIPALLDPETAFPFYVALLLIWCVVSGYMSHKYLYPKEKKPHAEPEDEEWLLQSPVAGPVEDWEIDDQLIRPGEDELVEFSEEDESEDEEHRRRGMAILRDCKIVGGSRVASGGLTGEWGHGGGLEMYLERTMWIL